MNEMMNCERCLECFAAIDEELAEPALADAVREHLRDCDACRAEFETRRSLVSLLRDEARGARAERIARGVEAAMHEPARIPPTPGRRRRVRWLVGTGVLAAVALATLPLVLPGRANASSFAAAAERVRQARTLRVQLIETRSDNTQRHATLLISGGTRYRVEWDDGRAIVARVGENRSLVLHTDGKWATYGPQTPGDGLDLYEYLMSLPERAVQEMGIEDIGGRPCRKFLARESSDGERELMVFVDLETQRPVRVETTRFDTGNPMVAGVIEFDPALDDALFSMDVPQGYASRPPTDDVQTAAVNVQVMLRNIAMGVMTFQQINGRYPATLGELVSAGVVPADGIINPRTPGVEFVYRRPAPEAASDPSADWGKIVLVYEALSPGHAGGAVCYLDSHVDLLAHDDYERVVNGK